MTVENVAVFLSVVGSAGTCWEISPEHYRTTSKKTQWRDLLLQHAVSCSPCCDCNSNGSTTEGKFGKCLLS
ncbi:hypothetical protein PAMP_000511 [Pampus punctatissimus]